MLCGSAWSFNLRSIRPHPAPPLDSMFGHAHSPNQPVQFTAGSAQCYCWESPVGSRCVLAELPSAGGSGGGGGGGDGGDNGGGDGGGARIAPTVGLASSVLLALAPSPRGAGPPASLPAGPASRSSWRDWPSVPASGTPIFSSSSWARARTSFAASAPESTLCRSWRRECGAGSMAHARRK